jgi:hypothetical protein
MEARLMPCLVFWKKKPKKRLLNRWLIALSRLFEHIKIAERLLGLYASPRGMAEVTLNDTKTQLYVHLCHPFLGTEA